jgi:hypothetical protein
MAKDTKGIIRISKPTKNRKYNGQKTIVLYCLFFIDLLILIAPLVSFGHCIVCSSLIYLFGLSLWYLLAIVLSVLRRFTDSDCPFGIFWPLYCVFFVDLLILITPLVSFEHWIVCSSSTYWFWLPLWYLLTIEFCVLRRFTHSDYPSAKNRQYNGQKIPKGQSESVNRRRTDNTMAKRNQRGNQNQ